MHILTLCPASGASAGSTEIVPPISGPATTARSDAVERSLALRWFGGAASEAIGL
jgi:hypothetical protein